jgi:hypothetical protein
MRPVARRKNRASLRVLNPRGQVGTRQSIPPAPRLTTLDRRSIAFLINTQGDKHDRLVSSLENLLKKTFTGVHTQTWRIPYALSPDLKKPILEQIANDGDAVIGLMGDSGSCAAKTALDLVSLEGMGKPTVFLVVKYFEVTVKVNAHNAGCPDPRLVVLERPISQTGNGVESRLDEGIFRGVVSALTQKSPISRREGAADQPEIVFRGRNALEALEAMEKYFLQHCWSDGFPLKPPTREAVRRMLEGTDRPADHVVGTLMPGGGEATVEKIAVNAVMAGCLPQHMPVLMAAVEAITDPNFDLLGVQCTAGMVSPILLISGRTLIEQLNINDSYSTLGPGWRANSTIGRALRLIMINIGHAWPGNPDMKAIGSPFKFVMLLAENERSYAEAWEPIRVTEGFPHGQPTISAMPAVTWQVRFIPGAIADVHSLVSFIGKQAKAKNDNVAGNWGMDNLLLLNYSAFDLIKKEGCSRSEFQKMVYDEAQAPCSEFFGGKAPSSEAGTTRISEEMMEKIHSDPDGTVPLLRSPENLKIVVAGAEGYGTAMFVYISTWGYGPAHFVTKPIKLPGDWEKILKRNKGWETPLLT